MFGDHFDIASYGSQKLRCVTKQHRLPRRQRRGKSVGPIAVARKALTLGLTA